MIEITMVVESDLIGLKNMLESIELFPPRMLDGMIHDYFTNQNTEDIWYTVLKNGIHQAIAFCSPEQLTLGNFNLHAIGVLPESQGHAIGTKMMNFIENILQEQVHRILIV